MTNINKTDFQFRPDEPVYCSFCRKRIQTGSAVLKAMGKVWCFSCQNKRQSLTSKCYGTCGRCGHRYKTGEQIGFLPRAPIWCIFCTEGKDPRLMALNAQDRQEYEEAVERVRLLEKLPGRSAKAEEELQAKLNLLSEKYRSIKDAGDVLKRHGRQE